MANILYRGSAVPTATNTAGAANAPLTNGQIDKNFYALNTDKLDKVTTTAQTIVSDITITGSLTVNGTTTTINSTTITVDDKLIELGDVTTPTDATADGGGLLLKGTSNKTIVWDTTNANWTSSEHLNIVTNKSFKINNVSVLNSTTLGTSVVNSSLTKIGLSSAGLVKTDASGNLSVDATSYLTSQPSITNDGAENTTHYPLFATGTVTTAGSLTSSKVSTTKLTFIPSTGTLGATNFDSLSDIRFKKDLEQISEALNKVKQLTGYTYTLIEENVRSSGLIAQDVELVLPEAVGGNDQRKTLAYGNIVGLLVEAIKELDNKVEDIKNQLANK